MVEDSSVQRIARLTPLATVLALMESRVSAVRPRQLELGQALGRTLAEDVIAGPLPPRPIALRDGYAIDAAAIADAGPYMPVALPPSARRIDAGEALPNGCDAVLPVDAVALRSGRREVVASVAPGEGVLAAGDDTTPRVPLRCAGERLRVIDNAVLAAAGVVEVLVREPRVRIVCGNVTKTPVIESGLAVLARVVAASGALVIGSDRQILEDALQQNDADAVFILGGTGSGRHDASVRTLARLGSVVAHGIAMSPGETAAFGIVGTRPVLSVPGRLDAALALWLMIGRHIVAKLAGGKVEDMPAMATLKRKVTSAVGLVELIPVECSDGMAGPLASGYLSLAALARSSGWIVVPADSEGFAAGTPVAVRPWP